MRILYITEASIEHDIGGGGDGTRKVYYALREYALSKNIDFGVISLGDHLPESLRLKPRKNRMFDVLSRLCGHSNYLYFFWRKQRKKILNLRPDIFVIGRSRYGFIAKDIGKYLPSCKVVCVFENVEYDYVSAYFSDQVTFLNKLKKWLEMRVVRIDEGYSVSFSDSCVFLSQRDLRRTCELYTKNNIAYSIIPICQKSRRPLSIKGVQKTLVFSGRLWYDANIESVLWILDHLAGYYKETPFIIAGSKPVAELKKRISLYDNVTLCADFEDSSDIIPEHALVLSPTFRGAGMKVKIADALSVGLPVVGTDEALVGYEEITNLDGVFRANTVGEFKSVINKYLAMDEEELNRIDQQNKAAFMRFYEYGRAASAYEKLIDTLSESGANACAK